MIADYGDYPPCESLSGSLIVVGSSDKATKNVELYNPILNQLMNLREKPVAVGMQTLVSLGNSVYCVGGWDGKGIITPRSSFSKFTPSTSEWIDLEPMKIPRMNCAAVAIDGKIFVNGGTELLFGRGTDFECYDVRSNQWTCLSPMPAGQEFPMAHHIKGWIFSIASSGISDQIEKYDIENDKWYDVNSREIKKRDIYKSVLVRF